MIDTPVMNGAEPTKKKAAAKPTPAIANELADIINERGWVPHDELVTDDETHAAVRWLKRQGYITPKPGLEGEPGWELVGQQRIPHLSEESKPTNKPYKRWMSFVSLTMEFVSLSYAQQGDEHGPFLFPRTADGRIFFAPKNFRAMLKKAWAISPIKETVGKPALERVRVKAAFLPADTPLVQNTIRRPVNTKGMAIGELRGEALPPGTRLTWEVSFPLSHFSQDDINNLLDICEEVGFSCAGNGAGGGGAGLFFWMRGDELSQV